MQKSNNLCSPDVGSMLAQHLRRWPNIEPLPGERIEPAGSWSLHKLLNNFFITKNRQQNKLVNMVNGNEQKQAKQNMAAKTTSFLYFCYKLLHDFWFLHDFELINLCLMFLIKITFFDLQIQNGYRQHTFLCTWTILS